MKSRQYQVGVRVEVVKLTKLERHNPEMTKYLGEKGSIILELPAEMGFVKQYRVLFDNPGIKPLAFFARELKRV